MRPTTGRYGRGYFSLGGMPFPRMAYPVRVLSVSGLPVFVPDARICSCQCAGGMPARGGHSPPFTYLAAG